MEYVFFWTKPSVEEKSEVFNQIPHGGPWLSSVWNATINRDQTKATKTNQISDTKYKMHVKNLNTKQTHRRFPKDHSVWWFSFSIYKLNWIQIQSTSYFILGLSLLPHSFISISLDGPMVGDQNHGSFKVEWIFYFKES